MEDQSPTGGETGRRVTVARAADVLGISVEAVRGRIKRDTLAHEKSEGGTVYVLLDTDQPDQARPAPDQSTDKPGESSALISQMREEISYLREENRRKDHIIAGLVERIPPQLEAPSEPQESPESRGPTRTPTDAGGGPQEVVERPWWRRMFGG